MTLAQWIDPADAANRVDGATGIKQIIDKSGTGNDVTAVSTDTLLCLFQNESPGTVFFSNDIKVRPANFFGNAQVTAGPSPTQSDNGALFINGGSPASRITFDTSPDFEFGSSEDFTIELWMWFAASPAPVNEIFWDQRNTSLGTSNAPTIYITGAGVLGLFVSGGLRLSHGTALPTNQWVHIACTRSSGLWRIFQNGEDQGGTYSNSGACPTGTPLTIGSAADGQLPLQNTYIDSVRFTRGTALYTGSFSPLPPDFYPECDKTLKFYQNKSPGDIALLPGPSFMMRNALTNMNGPDVTAIIALDRDFIPSPQSQTEDIVFGMWNDTSPIPSPLDGWNITNVFDGRLFRCNIGDVGFDLVADPGLSIATTSPQQSQTVFLASFDGPDGDTEYTSQDFGKRQATFSGTISIDNTQKYFGISSMYFDATGNGITFPDSSDWDFGNGDFTCEGWYYFNTTTAMDLFARWEGSGQRAFLFIKQTTGFELYITTNGSTTFQVGTTAQFPWTNSPLSTWHHIAICREGSTMRVYVDGVQIGSATTIGTSTIFNSNEPLKLGAHAGVNIMNGYMDNVRITKGECLYTGGVTFAVPTQPFVDSFNGADDAVIAVEFDSTNDLVRGYINGVYAGGVYYPGTLGFTNAVTIGGARGGAYVQGRVYDSIYYDGVMTVDQREKVEGYMAHKWSFNADLPAGHPYRDKGPEKTSPYDEQVFVANFNVSVDAIASPPGYTAETGQQLSFFADAQLDISKSKFSGASLLCDGTGDYATVPFSTDWQFGSGDFTVECWVLFNTSPDTVGQRFVCHWDDTGNENSWTFDTFGGELRFGYSTDGSSSTDTGQSISPSLSGTWNTGQWYHVAACRNGTSIKGFLDGVEVFDYDAGTESFFNSTDDLWIGGLNVGGSPNLPLDGQIDSIRIIKGRAIYKKNFTPPTSSFRMKPSAVLLANMDGLDGVSPIPFYSSNDASRRPATFYGQAQLDTDIKKFGYSSLKLDGTTDCIGFPHSAELNVGADDFTVEGWFYWTTDPSTTTETFVAKWGTTSPDTSRDWIWYITNNLMTFGHTTDGTLATDVYEQSSFNPVVNQWYHLVCERYKDQVIFHVDGANIGEHAVTTTINSGTAEMFVGGNTQGTGSQEFTGHIDGVRFVKGRALYSGIYPQETPFNSADDSSTLFWNCEGADGATSPATTDDATGWAITFNNNAQYDTAHRKKGTSSLYCAATNDYISLPNNSSLNPGTEFGLEFHVKLVSTGSSYQGIWDARNTGNTNAIYIGQYLSQWVFYYQGANRILGGTPVAGQWHHIYLEYKDTVFYLYADGVRIGSYTNATAPVQNGTIIGADFSASASSMTGWIDSIRFVTGARLYDRVGFTVPTAPPNIPEF